MRALPPSRGRGPPAWGPPGARHAGPPRPGPRPCRAAARAAGISAVAGVSFVAGASQDVAQLTNLAGYAAFGAVLYLIWAARARP